MKGSSFVDLLIEFLFTKLVRHVDMLMHAHPIEIPGRCFLRHGDQTRRWWLCICAIPTPGASPVGGHVGVEVLLI